METSQAPAEVDLTMNANTFLKSSAAATMITLLVAAGAAFADHNGGGGRDGGGGRNFNGGDYDCGNRSFNMGNSGGSSRSMRFKRKPAVSVYSTATILHLHFAHSGAIPIGRPMLSIPIEPGNLLIAHFNSNAIRRISSSTSRLSNTRSGVRSTAAHKTASSSIANISSGKIPGVAKRATVMTTVIGPVTGRQRPFEGRQRNSKRLERSQGLRATLCRRPAVRSSPRPPLGSPGPPSIQLTLVLVVVENRAAVGVVVRVRLAYSLLLGLRFG